MITREQANKLLSSLTDKQKEAIGDFPCGTLKCAICPFNIDEKGGCLSADCMEIRFFAGKEAQYDNH